MFTVFTKFYDKFDFKTDAKSDDKSDFKPDYNYNNLTSHLRNFLITTKYIKNKNGSYIILDKDLLKKFKKKEFSPKQLKKLLIEQELI